jgi:hypothetical protein
VLSVAFLWLTICAEPATRHFYGSRERYSKKRPKEQIWARRPEYSTYSKLPEVSLTSLPLMSCHGILVQFRLLLQLYRRPLAAFSAIMDQGQVLFAAGTALAVMLLFQIPREMEIRRFVAQAEAYAAAHKAEIQAIQEEWKRNPPPADLEEKAEALGVSNVRWAIEIFTGQAYFSYLPGLAAVAFLCAGLVAPSRAGRVCRGVFLSENAL